MCLSALRLLPFRMVLFRSFRISWRGCEFFRSSSPLRCLSCIRWHTGQGTIIGFYLPVPLISFLFFMFAANRAPPLGLLYTLRSRSKHFATVDARIQTFNSLFTPRNCHIMPGAHNLTGLSLTCTVLSLASAMRLPSYIREAPSDTWSF